MSSAAEQELACTVSGLSDDQLLEQTTRLALLDHQIQVFVIDHLLEIEARGLYLSRGFPSLFAYVARGLGYSDASAWRRINAMKLCARIEGARERLRDGSLTLDAAAQLQAAFERRDRERARLMRGAGAGMGSATKPNGAAPPASAQAAPIQGAASAKLRPAQPAQDRAIPALAPADQPLTLSATQPAPTPASAPKRHARTASAGTLPSKTPRDPDRGATSAPKRCARAGRAIPAAVRRQVWQRDEGGCSYVDPVSGRRCGSSHLLQVDHIFPYALGGRPGKTAIPRPPTPKSG